MKTLDPPVRRSAPVLQERAVSGVRRPAATWQTLPHALARPECDLVQRIIASRRFGRSTLLSDFLLFVTHHALSGRAHEINEQLVGVHVFARGENFNPGDDNIVRSYARMLRKRLEDYFRNEGRDEPLLLEIPRGAYVPVFTSRTAAALPASLSTPSEALQAEEPAVFSLPGSRDERHAPPLQTQTARSPALWQTVAAVLALILLSAAAGFMLATRVSGPSALLRDPAEQLSHLFWQQIFDSHQDTYIVPTDGGLVILRRFLERPVTLTEYVSGTYKTDPAISQGLASLLKTDDNVPDLTRKVRALGERRYTSVADLNLSTQLVRRPEVIAERLRVRYARDLRMDDLHGANAILIGSLDSNPWVELFQPQLNFQFTGGGSFGGSAIIVNRHPLAGEQASYASLAGDQAQRTYGVIALVPNLDGNGHVLIVEGINMAGTEAAGKFLLSAEKMQPVLEKARAANGTLHPFEILLSTDSVAANSSRVEILSERVASNP